MASSCEISQRSVAQSLVAMMTPCSRNSRRCRPDYDPRSLSSCGQHLLRLQADHLRQADSTRHVQCGSRRFLLLLCGHDSDTLPRNGLERVCALRTKSLYQTRANYCVALAMMPEDHRNTCLLALFWRCECAPHSIARMCWCHIELRADQITGGWDTSWRCRTSIQNTLARKSGGTES